MTLHQKRTSLLNRLILAQAYIWVKQVADDGATMPPIAYKIKSAGYSSFVINRFDETERNIIKSIADSEELKEIAKIQTSPVIQALEVMRIWIEDIPKNERPHINISDKKLKLGSNAYLINMLKLKKMSPEDHAEKRQIINETKENVEKWYNVVKKTIMEAQL